MTVPLDEVHRIADRLFAAFVAHDLDAARALLAEDCVAWGNALGGETDGEGFLAMLPVLSRTIGRHRYDDVRRIVTETGFVEQHRVRSTRPDGRELDLGDACVVVRLDRHGRVARLDEYVDTALVRKVLASLD